MSDFKGRTVLVTGAAGDIGGATVRHLVDRGADVVAARSDASRLEAVVAQTGARPLVVDLESEDDIKTALGDLDVHGVVNCGGHGGEIATPQDTDIGVFDKVMSINSRAALLVTKHTSRSMIRLGRGGAIDNVSSQASLVALPGHVCHGSSKASLDSITCVSALELGGHNIRVNSVNPTVVMTPMSPGTGTERRSGSRSSTPCPSTGGPSRTRSSHDHVPPQRRGVNDHRRLPADRRRLQLSLTVPPLRPPPHRHTRSSR